MILLNRGLYFYLLILLKRGLYFYLLILLNSGLYFLLTDFVGDSIVERIASAHVINPSGNRQHKKRVVVHVKYLPGADPLIEL